MFDKSGGYLSEMINRLSELLITVNMLYLLQMCLSLSTYLKWNLLICVRNTWLHQMEILFVIKIHKPDNRPNRFFECIEEEEENVLQCGSRFEGKIKG